MMKLRLILPLLALAVVLNAFSQRHIELFPQESSLKVTGTSSLHDWEMMATNLGGKIVLKQYGRNIEGFEKIDLALSSVSLSSNNSVMDRKAHDALEVDKHPDIRFSMTAYELKNLTDGNFQGTIIGNLTIAGRTNYLSIPFQAQYIDMNNFKVSGNKSLKMSDFGIDPPRAMLGALKTGDEVNVEFIFEFTTNPEANIGK